jgi:hypothetical protein
MPNAYRSALLRHFGLNESQPNDLLNDLLRDALTEALFALEGFPAKQLTLEYVFADRALVTDYAGDSPRSWEVSYRMTESVFEFGAPVEVTGVSLALNESTGKPAKGRRLTETIEQAVITEGQADANGGRPIRAIGITADVVNGNGRRYPRAVLAEAVARLNSHLHESNGQGKLIATGEAEHPSDKGGRTNILETVVKWSAASLDASGRVLLEGVILPTSKGRDMAVLVENGVPVGVSMRGYGELRTVREEGRTIDEVSELTIRGFDFVQQPSDPNGAVTEAQANTSKQEDKQVTEEEKKALEEANRKAQADLEEARKQQATMQAQLDEAQKAQTELAERKQAEAVAVAIAEATKDLKYGADMNKLFVDTIVAMKPATPEAVKPIVEGKVKEYDAMLSQVRLAAMGKVTVTGPVFEKQTGQPEYTRAAYELSESLVKAGQGKRFTDERKDTPAGRFAIATLERFDKIHGAKLLSESRQFEEAEQTSDLNLPYTVARMLIEQAYPELIAANVYDFGVTDMAPARIYYEAYAGESGSSATVTDEAMTASTADFVKLAHPRVRPGTVVVTNSGGGTTYTEGTDYVVDYETGGILAIATITNAQSILVDYTYDAFRQGEMQAIERAKNTLTYTQLDIAADRLAMEISHEAIVFSRSQLGYDAVNRTLGNLVRLVQRKIDKDILYKGLAAALRQASNTGGTWTSGSDDVSLFVKYLGVAKTKVYNRFYTPDAIIMSVTNADRLSNWDGFKVTGFSNALINAAGFAGSVKGLPIYASPEYPDGYAQIVHRELVAHRIFQPMTFKGPFPSFSNGKLVASEQYYAEEYNGSLVPVKEKTAYIKIA